MSTKELTKIELDKVLTVSGLDIHFKEFEELEKKNKTKKIKSDSNG